MFWIIFFSQLSAKASIPLVRLIPIQANTVGEDRGVSFQLNDAAIQICGEFSTRRNAYFSTDMAAMSYSMIVDYL